MSAKVASVTSATAAVRELRKDIATKTRKHEEETLAFGLLALFEVEATERWDHQSQRLIEAVRGDGLGPDAAAVADVGAAVERGIAVQHFGIEAGLGHADPVPG